MIETQHRRISPDLAVLFSGNFPYTPCARPASYASAGDLHRTLVNCGSSLAISIASSKLQRNHQRLSRSERQSLFDAYDGRLIRAIGKCIERDLPIIDEHLRRIEPSAIDQNHIFLSLLR
jgi:hypothetical protein